MQKRRGLLFSEGETLPVTTVEAEKLKKRHPRSRRGDRGMSLAKVFLLVASCVTLLFLVSSSIRGKRKNRIHHGSDEELRKNERGDADHEAVLHQGRDVIENMIQKVKSQQDAVLKHGKNILEQQLQQHMTSLKSFNSLNEIVPRTELIALYFGASWCPSCMAFTSILDQSFSSESAPGKDRILTPNDTGVKKDLAIVHVSSDATEEDMNAFLRQNWIAIPFHHPDRSNLKRFFRVCAEGEQNDLGIQRQYEIPSLIVIDSETRSLVTASGVHDVQVHGDKAIENWLKLRNVVTSMYDKYLKDS